MSVEIHAALVAGAVTGAVIVLALFVEHYLRERSARREVVRQALGEVQVLLIPEVARIAEGDTSAAGDSDLRLVRALTTLRLHANAEGRAAADRLSAILLAGLNVGWEGGPVDGNRLTRMVNSVQLTSAVEGRAPEDIASLADNLADELRGGSTA